MSPWRTIVQRALPSLLTLAVAILVALAVAIGSAHLEDLRRADFQQHHGQTHNLRSTLEAKQADLAYLQDHIALFRSLQQQGLTRSPERENWIDQLMAARQNLALPDTMTYALLAAKPVVDASAAATDAPPDAAPDAASAMPAGVPLAHDLDISLRHIHEGELLALLKRFQASITERFRVQSCKLSSPQADGLTADCTLRFFSLPPTPANAPITAP